MTVYFVIKKLCECEYCVGSGCDADDGICIHCESMYVYPDKTAREDDAEPLCRKWRKMFFGGQYDFAAMERDRRHEVEFEIKGVWEHPK